MPRVPFGAFNPRFYGVTMHLSDGDRIDGMSRYAAATAVEWMRNDTTLALEEVARCPPSIARFGTSTTSRCHPLAR